MAKQLIHDYSFDASTRTVTINDIINQDRFLMITNVTDNIILYIFSNPDFGFSSYSITTTEGSESTTLVLDYDTTSMSDTDQLQIFVEKDSTSFAPSETFVDPVSKIRVSQPENLIDTDFEYGLQSTKWETLELVKNIPTFYSRNGDESLDVSVMTRTASSDIITITTTQEHGLAQGNPILVQGTTSVSADGAFVVTKVIDANNLQYKAKSVQSSGGSILDTYTQVFVGSVYQGTEFQLSALGGVTTDAASTSTLTVTTETPTNFSTGTSFFLSNSVGSKQISFDSTAVEVQNQRRKYESVLHNRDTDAEDLEPWTGGRGHVQPLNWIPKQAKFFVAGTDGDTTITVNTASGVETITFNDSGHGFSDGDAVMYYLGLGNSVIGGLSERGYHVRVVDANTFYLVTGGPTSTTRVGLSSAGADGGYMRSCFALGHRISSINTSTETITLQTPIVHTSDVVYIASHTAVSNLLRMDNTAALDTNNYFDDDSGDAVYASVVTGTGNLDIQVSNTDGGSIRNLGSASNTSGILVPMLRWSRSEGNPHNSIYLPYGDWANGDLVQVNGTDTLPQGLENNHYYELVASGSGYPNRFRFKGIGVDPTNTNEVNLTGVGSSGGTLNVREIEYTDNDTPTGETGSWELGGVAPMNWVPSEGFFFIHGSPEMTVDTSLEQMTFSTPHGMTNGKPYVYYNGFDNANVGGLSDGRWYYIKVIDTTTIEFYTNSNLSSGKVNLSSQGSNAGLCRGCIARVYLGSSRDASSDEITYAEPLFNATTGGNQVYINVYTTFAGLNYFTSSETLDTYTEGSSRSYYAKKVTNSGQTIVFSNQINGNTANVTTGALSGATMAVSYNPNANSIWFANHGYETGHQVRYYSNSVPGGMSNGSIYALTKINNNRVSFQIFNNATPINFTTDGAPTGYHIIFPAGAANPNADFITATNHGLSDADLVSYDAGSGAVIKGLTDGGTYYVHNSSDNKFQLATTYSGFDGDAIPFTQSTSRLTSQQIWNVDGNAAHGLVTGDRVQYLSNSPLKGMSNGSYYFVYRENAYRVRLHQTQRGAQLNDGDTRILPALPYTGTATLRKSTAVDFLRRGTGTHTLLASTVGSSDGVYSIDSIVDTTSFTLGANSQISDRVVSFVSDSGVWIEQDAVYLPDHYFVNGQDVLYTADGGTAIGGLVSGTTYYLIRQSRNWARFAASADDVITNTYIDLTSKGTGTHKLTTDSITGEVIGPGTLSINASDQTVAGTGTNFTSFFNTGDTISVYKPETETVLSATGTAAATDIFTTATHGFVTGDMIIYNATVAPEGIVDGNIYYAEVLTTTTFKLYPTAADAVANTNVIDFGEGGAGVTVKKITDIGDTFTHVVKSVTSPGSLEITSPFEENLQDVNYTIGTSLLMRADGFALHRPYDGGVELIPSKNPDSSMIRQTRRYFRYQSGKGIQVSFAVNFSPSTQVDNYTAVGTTGTITTRYPHRLSTSLSIVMSGATTTGSNNYWNGIFAVASIVDDFTFTVTLTGTPSPDASAGPGGVPEFYVQSWSNSSLRCGLMDDQNGLYFDYDGSTLFVCRRNSTSQISGTAAVTFRSGQIIGTGTRFQKQLAIGERITIKGQTYLITGIPSDTLLYILPSYRGVSNSGCVITKIDVTRVPQTSWNLDKCDGLGPSGFVLRPHRIQMAYMDYSWYGAGKVRFGFKDQRGKVIYCHEFIHNNFFNEAYLRSGNLPARYEIENVGIPTYVPALAHWGTSVIMDGKFDADSAYLFTASSNDIQVTGSATVTVSAKAETDDQYFYFFNNRFSTLGYALEVASPNFTYNGIPRNVSITGANLGSNVRTRNPSTYYSNLPQQPYLVSVLTRHGSRSNSASEDVRNLVMINDDPTGTATTNSNYTVTTSTGGVPVVYDIPLISIRLAPSVDTNTPGFLGEREIINRMQLILNSVGILSTHNAEIILRLNGLTTNIDWTRVNNPSLSQLIYHTNQDTITGGVDIFNFRAQGGTGTSGRSAEVTSQDLGSITTLGNSILGGDNVFPDGPDVLTVVAKLAEDPSTVSTSNPFNITARVSWSESQA